MPVADYTTQKHTRVQQEVIGRDTRHKRATTFTVNHVNHQVRAPSVPPATSGRECGVKTRGEGRSGGVKSECFRASPVKTA
jgi:hypothetical protein